MNKSSSVLLKCLGISVAVGLAVCAMFYGLFLSHQELGVEPGKAFRFALIAFILAAIISLLYFRMKSTR
jgi:hypothetical protein